MAPAPYASMDPALRARLHARFPQAAHFAPVPEPAPRPAPFEIILKALVTGHNHGLTHSETATGIYGMLVFHGLISEGQA